MAARTRFVAQIGDDQRDLPKPGRRRGDRLRRRLDAHRRISDTVHIYLLVGNTCVLPHQGGIFLRSFATSYISLRNSWARPGRSDPIVPTKQFSLALFTPPTL